MSKLVAISNSSVPSFTLKCYPTVLRHSHIILTGSILFLAMGGGKGIIFFSLCPFKLLINDTTLLKIRLPVFVHHVIGRLNKNLYYITNLYELSVLDRTAVTSLFRNIARYFS